MVDIDNLINKFIREEISLSGKDISESAKSREWLLKRIQNKIDEKIGEPILYKDQPFLYFGSYFKGTKVSNVDEYDVLVVIDSCNGRFTQHGDKIGDGMGYADPNHKYKKRFYKSDDSGVSPTKLLNWLKGIVSEVVEVFDGTVPERAGQAITARIESKNISIDLVPAGIFEHTNRPDVIFYNIPKGDQDNEWILTNPREDIGLINDMADSCDNIKNVIRILKYIKSREQYNFLISSFAIECCVIEYAKGDKWCESIFINLMSALAHFVSCLNSKSIRDSFDSKNNLLCDVKNTEYYLGRVVDIFSRLKDLINESDTDRAYVKLYNILSNN